MKERNQKILKENQMKDVIVRLTNTMKKILTVDGKSALVGWVGVLFWFGLVWLCSYKGPRFCSQHPHGGLQSSVTLVADDPHPLMAFFLRH